LAGESYSAPRCGEWYDPGNPSAAEGIFSHREYIKMDMEHLDIVIKDIQADSKRMRLLHILGQQLELLINEGRPDLESLFASLQTETLVSEEEYGELRATFALEAVSPLLRREEVSD
jgi:hypothetical protein